MVKRRHVVHHAHASHTAQFLGPHALGRALGATAAIFLFIAAFMSWVNSYYNADTIAVQFPISFSVYDWTIIVGLIQIYVYAYLAGAIIATFYNRRLVW